MKSSIILRTALLMTACLMSAAPAQPSEGAKGLWHVIEQEHSSTLFYLVFNGKQSRLYDSDWKRMQTSFTVDQNKVEFDFPQGAIVSKISGEFQGEEFVGIFHRPHMQFDWKIPFRARRVTSNPDWQPWTFVHQAQGSTVDILGAILAKGPYVSEQQFRKAWLEEIEPLYYPILTHSLYSLNGAYQDERRDTVIAKAYSSVKGHWDALKAYHKGFASLRDQVVTDLKKHYPWVQLNGHLVPALSMGEFDYRFVILNFEGQNPRRFMMLGSDWIAQHLNQNQNRYLTAHSILTLIHLTLNQPTPFVRSEFAQRGIAAYLASRLDYSDDPADFLFQNDDEPERVTANFKTFAAELSTRFKDKTSTAWTRFFMSELRAPSYRFAYDFARVLSNRYESEQFMNAFQYSRLRQEMVTYIKGLKGVPEIKKAALGPQSAPSR